MQVSINPKTPKKVNSNIKALLSELGIANSKPEYLRFINRSSEYRNAYCFNNCEDEKNKTGCQVVYGWTLWEDRKKGFFEAEFHSVIKENGVLIDITPRHRNEDKILFVPDTTKSSGRKTENIWYSWSNLKMVNDRVVEPSEELEVVELDNDYSEVRYV
ncbi:hypothetical protein [Thalassotalea atypica]|uniref:hypothetical protein n=1 Tax=Thalassotalea atypica TaxID=2054316 RepID=UPI002573FE9D|nr:hypothetical protein [Thalassotalea atypica]